ncbi:hypothetical protein I33_4227 [Bacillus subtilis subsp. subtilis str. RO-NN-1]|nr:hypothetical protein I33_4227 [Bacillus subtilis subsp. subtilis str. RO-NN-1]
MKFRDDIKTFGATYVAAMKKEQSFMLLFSIRISYVQDDTR